ncbi:MAG: LarC family nickel insertion protein [Eggerthellaceae bacterium]|nr:LarC family nickel insertion protein [Eggerthellaceae bacterium]
MGKMLYLETTSGISGDMVVAALLDAGASERAVRDALASLPVDGFEARVSRVIKSGLDVCDFDVVLDAAHENHDHDMAYLHGHDHTDAVGRGAEGSSRDHVHAHGHTHAHDHAHAHAHEHRGMAEIEAILAAATLTDGARALARRAFALIAEAEAAAHGLPVDQVHFHEVGAVDSIADIVAAAVAFDDLTSQGVSDVVVTELCDGRGTVRCQHGIIPVPAPAVVNIARAGGIPLRVGIADGELVTPTGAALAAAARTRGELPERFSVLAVGMGAGKRAYDTPGFLRALVIEGE